MASGSTSRLKVAIFGNSGSGKTSLIKKMKTNEFKEQDTTIGIDYFHFEVTVRQREVKFEVLDTAGQYERKVLEDKYYETFHAVIIVYSIINEESFLNVHNWVKLVRDKCKKHVKVFLVGNKMDLDTERLVTEERGRTYAVNEASLFFETSARTGTNVEALFQFVAVSLVDYQEMREAAIEEGKAITTSRK